jgi:hypothetical protein
MIKERKKYERKKERKIQKKEGQKGLKCVMCEPQMKLNFHDSVPQKTNLELYPYLTILANLQ